MTDYTLMMLVTGIALGLYSTLNTYLLTKNKHLDKGSKGQKFFIVLAIASYIIGIINTIIYYS